MEHKPQSACGAQTSVRLWSTNLSPLVEHTLQSACGAQTSVRLWSTNLSPLVEHKRTEGYVIVSSAYGLMFELLPQKGVWIWSSNIVFKWSRRPSWSYGSWIYNYLCNQCLSPLMLWVRIPLRRGVLDTTLCDNVSVICGRSVVFSGYSGFFHQLNWPPRYNCNIVESVVKHHNSNPNPFSCPSMPTPCRKFSFVCKPGNRNRNCEATRAYG